MITPKSGSALTVLFGAICLLVSDPASAQIRRGPQLDVQIVNGREAAAREVLVRFRGPIPRQLTAVLADADPEDIEPIERTGLLRIRSRSRDVTALIAALFRRGDIAYVEPNYIVHALSDPNDPRWRDLWGLRTIQASEAWNISIGSTSTVVGVVDTGIDYTHPDLAANVWSAPADFTVIIAGQTITCPAGSHGFDAIAMTCDPMDEHDHGSHVSGTIGAAGDNGIGVVGVNQITQIMGLKFLDASGSGTEADAIKAIEFAIQAKEAFSATGGANVRVLSNSWGGTDFSQALLDEINVSATHDMLFVAAAGNSGISNEFLPTYPASYAAPNIISVAATTQTDGRAFFSNYGVNTVDLGAPGVDILSTARGDGYELLSGTSMATPHVSGAAALVLSRCSLDTPHLKEALLGSVDPVASMAGKTVTGGRLNVAGALHSCIAPPTTPTNLTAIGGDAQVRLTWSAAIGATRYRIKRGVASGGPYVEVTSSAKGNQHFDTNLANGTTYYYVISAVNLAGESGDSNEASATPRTASDLVVYSFSVPGSGGAGKPLTVSVTTRNQGLGGSDPSTTKLYLSDDTAVDPTDTLMTPAQAVPALSAGALAAQSLSVTVPSDASIGQHYVVAKADADDVLLESQEGNNTRARFLLVGPDLAISTFTAPTTAIPGTTMSLGDTVTNSGGDAAVASVMRFYWSTNATVDAGDTVLGSRNVPALEPTGAAAGQTTVTVPSPLTMGTYYVIAEADATKVVSETQEGNNTVARAVTVGGDLIVSAFTAPAKAGAGAAVTLTDTTTNQGSVAVTASVTRFYFSTNAQFDSIDTLLAGGHAVPGLSANTADAATTTVTLPSNIAPGSYNLIAKADADGTVAETQEGNNIAARSIQVGPDLAISAFTVPSRLGAGGSFVVNDTTTNQGGGDAGASVTQFYLSTNALLDASDTLLNGNHAVGALAASGSSSASTTIVIPGNTPAGSYYLFAKADGGNAVNETQETNNTAIKGVSIGPDVIVSSVFVTSPVAAGAKTTVTDTVTNQGGEAVPPTLTRFYLSTDITLGVGDIQLAETRAVPGLAVNGSSSGSTQVTIPAGTAAGSYYILAKADGEGVVAETSETNNTAPRGIQVQ
jgi:subtilase family serine protease